MPWVITAGGPLMYVLLLCSVVTVAVILERAHFWLSVSNSKREWIKNAMQLAENGRMDEALDVVSEQKGYLAYVLGAVLPYCEREQALWQKAAEIVTNRQLAKMKEFLAVLETNAAISPLFGILGTVVGILQSFGAIGPSGTDPRTVSTGIAVALLTTIAGLVVALLSLIPYNYFNAKLEKAYVEITKVLDELHLRVEVSK